MSHPEAIINNRLETDPFFWDTFHINAAILDGAPERLDEIRESIEARPIFGHDFRPHFARLMCQQQAVADLVVAYRYFGMDESAAELVEEYSLVEPEQPADTESAPE